MYDVGGKQLSGINSMYINSLTCVRLKGGESEASGSIGVRQGCIMSPWLFNVYMDAVMKEEKMGLGRKGVRFQEDRREWRLAGLLYADE